MLAVVLGLAGCGGGSSPTATPTEPLATSATATATPAQSTSAPPVPRTFTLVATGDLLLHPALWQQAERDAAQTGRSPMDFQPMLAAVRPYVESAHLGLCHLETPLAPRGGPYKGYPGFSSPPQIVDAVAATGYDACSTASNHTFDQGAAGVQRTLDELDAAQIRHVGSARTADEAAQTTVLDVNGVRVGLLSYTYGFNGVPYPNGDTWRANLLDPQRVVADAAAARQHGAEVVVAALHWGDEYEHEPNAQQRQVAGVLAQSPEIDILIGHHAHVVQPIERIGKTWVVYGMGNLVSAHATPGPANDEGLLVRFGFAEQPDGRYVVTSAEYVPLLMTDDAPRRVLDIRRALSTGDYGSATRARLEEALARTTQVVESRGGPAAGLLPAA